MAASFENLVRRNEIQLEAVRGMTEDIAELAVEWVDLAEWERASYALEWDNLAGSVRNMMADYRRGTMPPHQRQKLLDVVHRLEELRPIFERLQLSWPDVTSLAVPNNEPAALAARRSTR